MNFTALFKKDIKEIYRTYRIYVIPVIFIFFGLMSPILAKIMPDLLKSMAGEVKVELPPPTWKDAFTQYFKNISQIGLLAVILSYMGVIADEKSRGTAQIVLYRPVSRFLFVFSKFLAYSLLLLFSFFLSYLGCLYNTSVLFPEVPVVLTLEATCLYLVYAFFIGAITISASAIVKNSVLAGGIGIGGFALVSILPLFHQILAKYSPAALQKNISKILAETVEFTDMIWPIMIAFILSLLLIGLSGYVFSRQEL